MVLTLVRFQKSWAIPAFQLRRHTYILLKTLWIGWNLFYNVSMDEELRPTTTKDWKTDSHQRISVKSSKRTKDLPKEAQDLIKWIRKYLVRQQLKTDFIVMKLSTLPSGDLRTIASLFKAYDGDAMRSYNNAELIQFIAARHLSEAEYLPIGPMPYGSLVDIEGD